MIIFDKPLSIFVLWQEIVDFVVVLSKESIVDARNEKEGRKVVSLIFHNNFVKSHSLFLVLDGVTENSLKRIRIGMTSFVVKV